jgi:hypothetical protein
MNLRLTGTAFLLLSAVALIAFGLADYINAALGVARGQTTLLNNFWPMEAIALGAAIILGFAYPQLRGIRRGDQMVALVPSRQVMGAAQLDFFSSIPVTALEDGRVGSKIKVQVDHSRRGEGIITAYAGTITPATLRLTETER